VQPLPQCLTENWGILTIRQDEDYKWEVLVKWKDMPTCENSWSYLYKMKESFLEFHLEDKVNFMGGGIDTNQARLLKCMKRESRNPLLEGPRAHT